MKKVKMIAGAALMLIAAAQSVNAQTALHPWAINVEANFKDYSGEYGNGVWQFRNPFIQPGIGAYRYINNFIDAGLSASYGRIIQDPTPSNGLVNSLLEFKGTQISINGRFKINNGLWLKEDAFVAPYVNVGLGYYFGTSYLPDHTSAKADMFNIPLGIGCNLNLTKHIQMYVQSCWLAGFTDKFDNLELKKPVDRLWEHKFGFSYCFGAGVESSPKAEKAAEPAK